MLGKPAAPPPIGKACCFWNAAFAAKGVVVPSREAIAAAAAAAAAVASAGEAPRGVEGRGRGFEGAAVREMDEIGFDGRARHSHLPLVSM